MKWFDGVEADIKTVGTKPLRDGTCKGGQGQTKRAVMPENRKKERSRRRR